MNDLEIIPHYVKFNEIQELRDSSSEKSCNKRRYEFNGEIPNNLKISMVLKDIEKIIQNKMYDGYPLHQVSISLGCTEKTVNWGLDGIRGSYGEDDKDFREIEVLFRLGESLDSCGLEFIWVIIWTDTHKAKVSVSSNWRKQVLEKDNVCICCGGDKHLEAHHIFQKAEYPDLASDPNNGGVLCKWCHKKYHSYYHNDINPRSLIKFLKRFGDIDGE